MSFEELDIVSDRDIRDFHEIQGTTSRWEAMSASYDLSHMGTAQEYLKNQEENRNIKDDRLVEPEELNRLFPDMEVPFAQATGIKLANLIAERQHKQNVLRALIASSPQDTRQAILNIASGMAAHATDGIEFAGGLLGASAMTLALPEVAGAGLLAFAARAGISLAGGIAGNVAVEPLLMKFAQQNQENYTAWDAARNTIEGALLGTAVHIGGGAALDIANAIRTRKFGSNFKTAVALAEAGKKIDIPEYRPPKLPDEFFGMNTKNPNLKTGSVDGVYYASSSYDHISNANNPRVTLGDGILSGHFMATPNPEWAVDKIHLTETGRGSVYRFEIAGEKPKLLDLDTEFWKMPHLMEPLGVTDMNKTLMEFLRELPLKDRIAQEDKLVSMLLSGEGENKYDGAFFDYTKGSSNIRGKEIVFFDKTLDKNPTYDRNANFGKPLKYNVTPKEFKPDIDSVREIQERITSPISDQFHDPESRPAFNKRNSNLEEDIEPEKIISEVESKFKFPEESKEAKYIKELKNNVNLVDEVLKAGTSCLR